MTDIPEGFGLYDVKGSSRPLVITHETAKELKAKPHDDEPVAEEPKAPAKSDSKS